MARRGAGGSQSKLIIGVDLGGTRFRVAAVAGDGRLLQRIAEPTRVHEGRDAVLRRIYAAIRQVRAGAAPRRPLAVGLAAPGPLNPWTGVIYSPPNMPGWDEVPLKEIMEEELGLPVLVGNDANVAALGEHRFGAGRGCSDIVYITVSTGIGGGIISGNRLLLGGHGLAGEIGHQTIIAGGPLCGCGNYGCLEALSSGTAIARRMQRLIEEGAGSVVLEMAGGDLAKIDGELIVEAARSGDALARQVMQEAGECLGVGVANVVHLLNPQMVIIGGGVSNAGALLFQPVWDVVARRTMVAFRTNLRIVPAQLGDDVGLLGCAALVLAGARAAG